MTRGCTQHEELLGFQSFQKRASAFSQGRGEDRATVIEERPLVLDISAVGVNAQKVGLGGAVRYW